MECECLPLHTTHQLIWIGSSGFTFNSNILINAQLRLNYNLRWRTFRPLLTTRTSAV